MNSVWQYSAPLRVLVRLFSLTAESSHPRERTPPLFTVFWQAQSWIPSPIFKEVKKKKKDCRKTGFEPIKTYEKIPAFFYSF